MVVLGLETSCDETSAAVITADGKLQSNVVLSQHDHARYGGVVPELASRAHIRTVGPVVEQALQEAGCSLDQLDAIAVTHGPGLVGSLLVGVNIAKGLAYSRDLALIGVHHLEGHLYSAGIERPLPPPFVALLVSGGHTELIHVRDHGSYEHLGRTLDDAAGEAFDKVARLLDLLPPDQLVAGGRAVSDAAEAGDPQAVKFPRPLPEKKGLDFSFSGLKTAVRTELIRLGGPGSEGVKARTADMAASFQQAVIDVLVRRACDAVESTGIERLSLVGGVAANRLLRESLCHAMDKIGVEFFTPSSILCTDNAAMIAAAGRHRLLTGERSGWDLDAHPRLALPGLQHE
ncbi:MAG: tRNA (adenosine(37)-N6)-threonylcarbamoyltransferase complex transferase subunit TsaD [bacterium]|nr:tRNA (adenosine(37)-N6)-threonylcarbamoyltransferase complex transferase subunit TsaD [bacterium]